MSKWDRADGLMGTVYGQFTIQYVHHSPSGFTVVHTLVQMVLMTHMNAGWNNNSQGTIKVLMTFKDSTVYSDLYSLMI